MTKDMTARRRWTILSVAALASLAWAGCTLSPDQDQQGFSISIRVVAQTSETRSHAKKTAVVDLIDHWNDDPESFLGKARILAFPEDLPDDCHDLCAMTCQVPGTLVGQSELELAVVREDGQDILVLAGDLTFELRQAGTRYRLEVDLVQQGHWIEGRYAGAIELNSGLTVDVERLVLGAPDPSGGMIDSLEICLDSVHAPEGPTCVSDLHDFTRREYDVERNLLYLEYTAKEDSDPVALVTFRGGLQPAPIFSGCIEIESLESNFGALIDVTIILDTTPTGPGLAGEILDGNVALTEIDSQGNTGTQETGVFRVVRTIGLD